MSLITTKATYRKYPAYKDSGVEWLGEIPQGWILTRLGSFFKERKTKVSDKDFPPLSVTKNGILPQLETAAKSNDGDNRKLVKKGDFVINSRSDRKGSSGIANQDGSVSLINIVMVPKSIYPVFCNYLLKSTAFVEENYRIGHGIVADLWTTRYDEMKNIKIAIPPLPEQTAIANFLDDKCAKIDRAIAQKEKLIALLKERKQIVIQNAVTGKTVWSEEAQAFVPLSLSGVEVKDSGVEWIGEVPEHWEVKKMAHVCKIDTGSTPDRSNQSYWNGDIPWVKTGEVNYSEIISTEESITEAGLRNSAARLAPIGTLLMAMYGQGVTRGRVSLLGIEATYNQACCAMQFNRTYYNKYAYYYFVMAYPFIRDDGNETSQMNISASYISALKILQPRLEEQLAIVNHINTQSVKIDQTIALQQSQIDKLKEYKATLIDSAVTGKIKVS